MTDGDRPNLRTLSRVINKNRKNGALSTLSFNSRPQELSDHVSPTSYDRSDRRFDTTIDRDFIDDYPIFRVSPW
jgi:hypothetical protein